MRATDIRAELPPLLHLAWPLILAELGWMAMSVVDTVMLGRLPDSAVAMSAASLTHVLFNMITFGVGGVLLGLDSLISQAFGAREITEANRWLVHGVLLAVAVSALLIPVFTFGPVLLLHLPADRAVLVQAVSAIRGLSYGVLPLLLYFTLRRYMQAAQHVPSIAFTLVSANLVNAAADWLLIFGHRWHIAGNTLVIPAFGVTGSSWATSFARLYMFAAMLAAVWLADRRHGYGLRSGSRQIQWQHMRRLLVLGLPAGANIFVEIAIFAAVTALIATFGPLSLAGHEIALECASTTWMVPFAISNATGVRVGHAIGRLRAGFGTPGAASAAGWSGIGAGALFMLFASTLLLSLPAPIARLFTPDRAVIAAAVPLLLVAAGFQFFDGVQITATGALRGAGNTQASFYTQFACHWLVGLPLGLLLAFRAHFGAVGLWLGLLIGLVGAAATLLTIWRKVARRLTREATATSLTPM